MSEANETLAHRFRMDIFVEGNLDAADEILSPDFVWHGGYSPGEDQRGPEPVKQVASAISDYIHELTRMEYTSCLSVTEKHPPPERGYPYSPSCREGVISLGPQQVLFHIGGYDPEKDEFIRPKYDPGLGQFVDPE
jgi:hypothetical protein